MFQVSDELSTIYKTHASLLRNQVFETIPPNALFEAFHPTFPRKSQTLTQSPKTSGGIEKLPVEIRELIFAALSPSSLDAARYTCQSWHVMIMTSPYILESVLKKTTPLTRDGLHNEEWLRILQRQLDIEGDLVQHHSDSDVWRTRFRQCEIDFLVAPICSHSHINHSVPPSTFASAMFCIAGTPIACLTTELQAPTLGKSRQMILYHVGSPQRPYYIGSIPFDAQTSQPFIAKLVEIDSSYDWKLAVDVGGSLQYYAVSTVPAFSSNESPFILKTMAAPEVDAVNKRSRFTSSIKPRVGTNSQFWEHFEFLPSLEDSRIISSDQPSSPPTQLRLAKHRVSGLLYVAYVKNLISTVKRRGSHNNQQPSIAFLLGDLECEQEIVSLACLSPPRNDCVFRNVAIAPLAAIDGTVQIAIIWQDCNQFPRRSELYVYEAFPFFTQDNEGSRALGQMIEKLSSSALDSNYLNEESITQRTVIQAKRLRSLHPHAGGIHPSSPLRQHLSKTELDRQGQLGGLQVFQTGDKMRMPIDTKATYQAIYVWGPTTLQQLSLTIFDLSYSLPSLRTLPKRFHGPQPQFKLSKADTDLLHHYYTGTPCQCALHDDGYQVVLPDVRCAAIGAVKGGYQIGWSKEYRPEPTGGSLTRWDTPARVEALERKDEWVRERIRHMKRMGMEEKNIRYAWHTLQWTNYGMLEMPWGWKELKG